MLSENLIKNIWQLINNVIENALFKAKIKYKGKGIKTFLIRLSAKGNRWKFLKN